MLSFSLDSPEFKSPPTPQFYSSNEFPGHYDRAGTLSPYGEQMLFVTDHVAKTGKNLTGETMSQAMLEWALSFGGRPDSALKTFIDNMQKENNSGKWPNCGADDDQGVLFVTVVNLCAERKARDILDGLM